MPKGKNKDLLKEAIADAKAVRETALKNAKLALEEAFTPKLQSMLSAKLQKEVEGEDEFDGDDEDAVDQVVDTDIEEDDDMDLDDEVPAEPAKPEIEEEDDDLDIDVDDEEETEPEVEEETVPSGIGTADNKEPVEQPETEDPGEGELTEEDEEDTLDLESIIKELEGDEDLDIDIDDDTEEPAVEEEDEPEVPGETEPDEDDDVEISMEELYSALREMDGEDVSEPYDANGAPSVKPAAIEEEEEDAEKIADLEKENDELEKELGEAYKVIKFMKAKLNEVNLINAKLLFTNKLFKAFNLANEEKIKVVETLDRAQNAREAKLVFVTLAESFSKGKAKPVSKSVKKLTENISRASKAQPTTKPKAEILSEGNDMVARFRKLANIKKQ